MIQENTTSKAPWSLLWLFAVASTLCAIAVLISTNGQIVPCLDHESTRIKAIAGEPRAISEMASCSKESTEMRYWLRIGWFRHPSIFGSHLAKFYLNHPSVLDADRKADLTILIESGDQKTRALAKSAQLMEQKAVHWSAEQPGGQPLPSTATTVSEQSQ